MALLAAEAAKLSNNELLRGVIEEVISVDNVFRFLPFIRTEGKAHVYNRENGAAGGATATFLVPNVDVPENAAAFTQVTVVLKIIAGDVDVDNFLAQTQSDVNSQKAVQIAFKAKAVSRLFSDKMINGVASTAYDFSASGGSAGTTNVEFDGLDVLAISGQTVSMGTNGATLSLVKLDEIMDKVPLGIDAFIFSRRTLRTYKGLLRGLSSVEPGMITLGGGVSVPAYSGIPILMNDFVSDAKTVGTAAGICSTVYGVRFNEDDGVFGIYNGDNAGFVIQEIGQLEKRDATRTRIKWYVGMGLRSTVSLVKLTGVLV